MHLQTFAFAAIPGTSVYAHTYTTARRHKHVDATRENRKICFEIS